VTSEHTMADMIWNGIVLLAVSAVLQVQADMPPNLGGMGAKNCPSIKCSKGYEAVQKRPMLVKSMGCSGFGGGMMMMQNKADTDVAVTKCCDQKHACYQTCGAKKKVCDEVFEKCQKRVCGRKMGTAKENCEKDAQIQTMMAQFSGCKTWDEKQRASCDCVKAKRAPKRREQTLADFYKKHNKEKIGSAAGLAKKLNTGTKFAKVLTKLFSKYPKSIKKIRDPAMGNFEEMMNNIRAEDAAKEAGGGSDEEEGGFAKGRGSDDEEEDIDLDSFPEPRDEL